MKKPTGTIQELLAEISTLKKRIEELEQSERIEKGPYGNRELLEAYLENAPDGIYMNDMEGNIIYGNRKSEEIVGYSREELIGKNMFEANLLSEGSMEKAFKLFQINLEGKPTGPDELELISKEGHIVPVEINASVFQYMDQRVILGFVRDITERKRVEKALRDSERKFRSLFDTANDAIFILKDYLFVDCNLKTSDIFRCDKKDIVGRSPSDF